MNRFLWLLICLALTGLAQARDPLSSRSAVTDHPDLAPLARYLPVICYHEVDPNPQDGMTCTPHEFESHMAYLHRMGYQPIRLEEARMFFWGTKHMRGKPILISFDDGYPGVYKYALPILEHFKFPSTFFLVVGTIGTPGHLSLEEVLKLRDSGLFDFGSHTYDLHTHISQRLKEGGVFPNQVLSDLKKSRTELKRLIGVDPTAFAWPYGYYDAYCLQIAAKAGFNMQFSIDTGATRFGEGALRIRRLNLHGSDFKPENFRAILEHL